MSKIASLGNAFVDVHANTDPFANELRRAMRRLSIDLREDTDRQGRLIGQRLGLRARQGLREAFGRRALTLDADVNLSSTSVARTETALRALTRDREVDIRVNRRGLLRSTGRVLAETGRLVGIFTLNLVRIFGDLFNFGRQIGQIFGESFRNLSSNFQATGRAAVSLSSSLVQLVAAVAALTTVIILLGGAFGILLALLVPVVNTVQLLLTLLPGLAVGLLVGIAPLVLVFTNLADAIKATTGELDEFQEEIEDFGANTRGVLTGLRDLVQFFLGIREQVQEGFFRPVNEAINNLDNNLGPTFRDGFVEVAEAAGSFAAAFVELFNHPLAIPFFEALFELAELGFEEIGESVVNLVAAFANLIDESIPDLRELVDDIAATIQGWADSINEFANDPNFQETIDGWKESFEDIRDLVAEILETVGNLVAGFEDEAGPILEEITKQFEDLNEFLTSDEGEFFFEGLATAAQGLILVLEGAVRVVITFFTLLGRITEAVRIIRETLGEFGVLGTLTTMVQLAVDWEGIIQEIKDLWDGIAAGVQRLIEIISGEGLPFTRQLRGVVGGIATFAGRVQAGLAGAFSFASRLLSPLGAVNTLISGIASFARTFRNALDTAAFWAGRIRDRINAISFPSVGGFLSGIFGLIPGLQEGGIVTRPTQAVIGEAGPEVVIPLTRPERARELLAVSGLADMVRGGDGASAGRFPSGTPVVQLRFVGDDTEASSLVLSLLQRAVRVEGGNVQEVVGS